MARYRGPKNRLARREGVDLGLHSVGSTGHNQLMKRLKVGPGQHGHKAGRRKSSDYSHQLREKQKVKRMYGVLDRQFKKYFDKATLEVGNTGEALLVTLERRLDNVIYRMGLSATRQGARQMVTHGHVIVDGKKVNIPSFAVRKDQVVTIKQKMLETPLMKKLLGVKDGILPAWLDRKGPVGKIIRMPNRDDIREDINEQLIIEFYSR